jgi:hypothetical protein
MKLSLLSHIQVIEILGVLAGVDLNPIHLPLAIALHHRSSSGGRSTPDRNFHAGFCQRFQEHPPKVHDPLHLFSCPWVLTRRDRHDGSGPFFAGLDQGGNEHQKGRGRVGVQDLDVDLVIPPSTD